MSLLRLTASLSNVLSPGSYTSLANPIYRRTPIGSVLLCSAGSGVVRLFNRKTNFSATWRLNYSDQNKAFDDDLSTSALYSVGPNQAETSAIDLDFGSTSERYILVRLVSGSSLLRHRIYTSIDGQEWELIAESNSTSVTSLFIKAVARYLKITVANSDSVSRNSAIYEIAPFTTSEAILSRTVTYTDKIVIDEIYVDRYWLWIDPAPVLNVSVFERTVPSEGAEIWVM